MSVRLRTIVAALAGGWILLRATASDSPTGGAPGAPRIGGEPPSPGSERTITGQDEEAAARMVASENPSGTPELWAEQIHSQLRSRRPGQSLYDRITGGAGWGSQNGRRPVSTAKEAAEVHRQVAREVLSGARPSKLAGARKFFHPEEQDAVAAQVRKAREDQAAGREISARSRQLLEQGYALSADEIRASWSKDSKKVGAIGPVEFWT